MVPLLPRVRIPPLSVSPVPVVVVVGNGCWADDELTGGVSSGVLSDEGFALDVIESVELGMDCPAPREARLRRGVIWLFPFLEELGRGISDGVVDEPAADDAETAAALEVEVEERAPDPEALGVPEEFAVELDPVRTLDPLPVLP
jgi:hypothetical protein